MKKKIIPKVLCVIPAKKSSRRLKKKNKKIINGHPMIAWTIHEAKKTKKISDLIVSTDCEKIMKIAREYGASTPFKRPSSLSKSNIDNYVVIDHALNFMEKTLNIKYDIIILLQPTSPVRDFKHINETILKLWNSRLNTAASVKGPFKKKRDPIIKKIKDNKLIPWCSHSISNPEEFYLYNASIYASRRDYFVKKKKLTSTEEIPIKMNKFYSIDVDEISDFIVAENYLKYLNKGIKNDKN